MTNEVLRQLERLALKGERAVVECRIRSNTVEYTVTLYLDDEPKHKIATRFFVDEKQREAARFDQAEHTVLHAIDSVSREATPARPPTAARSSDG